MFRKASRPPSKDRLCQLDIEQRRICKLCSNPTILERIEPTEIATRTARIARKTAFNCLISDTPREAVEDSPSTSGLAPERAFGELEYGLAGPWKAEANDKLAHEQVCVVKVCLLPHPYPP